MLLQIQLDDLGIDYIDRRNGLIDAVTIEDVRRVAKRLAEAGMLGDGGRTAPKHRRPRKEPGANSYPRWPAG